MTLDPVVAAIAKLSIAVTGATAEIKKLREEIAAANAIPHATDEQIQAAADAIAEITRRLEA